MRKYCLILTIVYSFTFAQTKDYSKLSKDELINIINSNEKEIKSLREKLVIEKSAKDKLESKQSFSINSEIAELKKSIKETNSVFLREMFDNKYVNKSYLMETDLGIDDISTRIENSKILITSILLDETNKDVFEVCKKALIFNQNYLKLFEIRNNVLNQKYDVQKVTTSIKEIEDLPILDENSKLDVTKNKIRNLLKNYLENTCFLKKTLSDYKRGGETSIMKQKYSELEKSDRYKDYPYLIKIIKKIKNNINDYTNDDLQPCEEVKTTTTDPVKSEGVKEGTPTKENDPKSGKQ
ncbi:hypothetical protein [Flavobacterium sp.]|uniref:hypothetical protein n=1 Tax=Flavobacterium sp. TaxID=239 RepID=UPI0033409086